MTTPSSAADLHHDRRGSGEPLVLVHGIGSRWQAWTPVLDAVAHRREVWAVDLPGFGASPPEPGVTTIAELATRVEEFCAFHGLDRPHVGGFSMGGGVALELGRRGVVRSVVAFAPVGFWEAPDRRYSTGVVLAARGLAVASAPVVTGLARSGVLRRAVFGVFYGQPQRLSEADCIADARALAGAPGFHPVRRALGTHRFDASDVGALADVPVTVAWGTRDVVLPYRPQAGRARRELPFARHVDLPRCGHVPFVDDPATCARLLLSTPLA